MIHSFLIPMTHTTPIHQNAPPKHKIIQCKDLPMNHYPHKKSHPLRDLSFPKSLPRKNGGSCTPNDIIIRPGIKLAAAPLMRSVTPTTPRDPRLNALKERVVVQLHTLVCICLFLMYLFKSKVLNFPFQCASAVDNLAAYYFNNITMGEAPNSPAAMNLARHIVDCPNLFPEVRHFYLVVQIDGFIICN